MAVIGVVGLGVMGLGIAQLYAAAGHRVIATDTFAPAREAAVSRLQGALASRVAAGKMTAAKMGALLAQIEVADDLAALAPADLIIEAIAEDLGAKQALFAKLEPFSSAILASNTSSLSIMRIARALHDPSRLIGLHFFNPAPVMKLVELVATPESDPVALSRARAWTEGAGKVVVACADSPGFIVNRCARPYYGEALAMLQEGRTAAEIDAAMLAAGYRLGPFALIDLIGADINLAATEGLSSAMDRHPRYHVFDALRMQVAKGDLGRKSGRGFVFPDQPGPAPLDSAAIVLRIEATLINEAASLLAEGGVDEAAIDTAMRLGLNFPRGPFEAARIHGIPAILAMLETLKAQAPAHLTARYIPSPGLEMLQ